MLTNSRQDLTGRIPPSGSAWKSPFTLARSPFGFESEVEATDLARECHLCDRTLRPWLPEQTWHAGGVSR